MMGGGYFSPEMYMEQCAMKAHEYHMSRRGMRMLSDDRGYGGDRQRGMRMLSDDRDYGGDRGRSERRVSTSAAEVHS